MTYQEMNLNGHWKWLKELFEDNNFYFKGHAKGDDCVWISKDGSTKTENMKIPDDLIRARNEKAILNLVLAFEIMIV